MVGNSGSTDSILVVTGGEGGYGCAVTVLAIQTRGTKQGAGTIYVKFSLEFSVRMIDTVVVDADTDALAGCE